MSGVMAMMGDSGGPAWEAVKVEGALRGNPSAESQRSKQQGRDLRQRG